MAILLMCRLELRYPGKTKGIERSQMAAVLDKAASNFSVPCELVETF